MTSKTCADIHIKMGIEGHSGKGFERNFCISFFHIIIRFMKEFYIIYAMDPLLLAHLEFYGTKFSSILPIK